MCVGGNCQVTEEEVVIFGLEEEDFVSSYGEEQAL